MSDTRKYPAEKNQLNALEMELKRTNEKLSRVKEELKEENERRSAMEVLVENYLVSANETPGKGNSSEELDKEIKDLRKILVSTKDELKDVYTQRNSVEQMLKKYLEGFGSFEAVSRLTSLIELNPEAIVALDLEQMVLEWNPAAEKLFGWKREEIIGRPYPIVGAEHMEDFKSIQRQVTSGGQIKMLETIRQTKDGQQLNVSISSMPLKNESNEIIGTSTIIRDLTVAKKRADLANRLVTVVEQSPNMIMITDKFQVIEYVNQSFLDVTGYSVKDLVGKKASILKSDRTPSETLEKLGKTLSENGTFQGELINTKKNGEYYIVSCLISPLHSEDGIITHYASIQEDLTEISKLKKALLYKSNHDSLTGLHNQKSFKSHIRELIIKAKAEATDHAIAIIDLDGFELFNNNCGSKGGDSLIKKVGGIIKSNVKGGDLVSRMSRDIFGVLIQYSTLHQAEHQIDIIRKSIQGTSFKCHKQIYNITSSIGLVPLNGETESVETAIANAEVACRTAKEQGKNRCIIFSESHTEIEKRHEEMELAARIMHALDEDELFLLWQPIVPLQGGDSLICYEMLVNMHDKAGKIIGANNFLSVAEKYGISHRIDLWVFKHLLNMSDKSKKILDKIDIITLNISNKSVGDPEIQRSILENIDSLKISPSKLCFEISEKASTSGLLEIRQFMYALKNIGCQVSIENFGTRISSFSNLKLLPFDYLKIDRSFIRNIVESEIDRVFVKSINDISHAMGKKTIADFINSDGILEELKKIGVNYGQGSAIGSPVRADKLVL